ncbi:MAG: sulfotransferase domain-containing protein [Planctomycetota bacterium]
MPRKHPNTFVIGAPKCGTSAMAHYLNCHPNVFLCDPKEPFFWSTDYPILKHRHGINSLDAYLALFSAATDQHRVICEGSTNYLASKNAISNILGFNRDAKFIVMLRNPVDVVHAFHSEILFSCIEDEPDFEKAWHRQEARKIGQGIPEGCEAEQFLQYGDVASYAPQLERFFELVPEHNRKVILFDDFAADNALCYRETLQFLGLPEFAMEKFERVNAAHGHRFPAFSKFILSPPQPVRPIINTVRFAARKFKGGWIDQAKKWFRQPEKRKPLSPEFQVELSHYFKSDIQRTSEILGKDLSHWLNTEDKCEASDPSLVISSQG